MIYGDIALATLPCYIWVNCHSNWLHCHGLIAVSIGFIAVGWLHYNWLRCHGFVAILIGFTTFIGALLIQLTSLPFLGYISFPIGDRAATYLLACNYVWPNVIGLLVLHLPCGAPFAFRRPHSIWCAFSIPMTKGNTVQCFAIIPLFMGNQKGPHPKRWTCALESREHIICAFGVLLVFSLYVQSVTLLNFCLPA